VCAYACILSYTHLSEVKCDAAVQLEPHPRVPLALSVALHFVVLFLIAARQSSRSPLRADGLQPPATPGGRRARASNQWRSASNTSSSCLDRAPAQLNHTVHRTAPRRHHCAAATVRHVRATRFVRTRTHSSSLCHSSQHPWVQILATLA
jgi:hypothetical protein